MLTSPGCWLAVLCGLGTLLLWCGRVRTGRLLATLGAGGLLAIAILPIDQWILAPLENRFPPPGPQTRLDGIMVLGGTVESVLSADRGRASLNSSAERLTEFATQARLHPEARLVFTGGPLPDRPDGPPEADGARLLLSQLGLPTEGIVFEDRSRTTWENALFASKLVQPKPGVRWLVITSASHMARSIATFRAVGWELVADPVGYKTYLHPDQRARRGFGERMELVDLAAHEWIGLAYYRLRGRSTELFPRP